MAAGGDETLCPINGSLRADHFAENHLENSGAVARRVRHGVHSKALRIAQHTREWKTYQDARVEGGRTATAEEVKRGVEVDQDTRPPDPSSSSTDPDPRRLRRTTVTDVETPAHQMDEDTSLRTPATSHPWDPDAEENVSKKVRVARSVHHIRGEEELEFDVSEDDWPNAELAVRSSYEGALNDGLPADKVKAGDEREITQMTDLQLYSWIMCEHHTSHVHFSQ